MKLRPSAIEKATTGIMYLIIGRSPLMQGGRFLLHLCQLLPALLGCLLQALCLLLQAIALLGMSGRCSRQLQEHPPIRFMTPTSNHGMPRQAGGWSSVCAHLCCELVLLLSKLKSGLFRLLPQLLSLLQYQEHPLRNAPCQAQTQSVQT